MRKIFLTGATGVMGMKGMEAILRRMVNGEDWQLTVLARQSKINRKKLAPFEKRGVKVIWGDLLEPKVIERGVMEADVVLHVGGMVSPAADWYPEKTYRVNTESMRLIVEAAMRKETRGESVTVVYVGSVAQYGNRPYPMHCGRSGDPICSATFDKYALSKIKAELILSESGLKRWVSIRQTSIVHAGLLGKADNPVAFHVPMANGLEWVSDDDSGELLAALCREDIPEEFWKGFYNVGGGESYRMSNYEFMKATLAAVGCPAPEKVFELNWFATRNFHGMYFLDSQRLDSYLHFRNVETFNDYMARLKKGLPLYYRLAPLAPAWIIKTVMGRVADKERLGTRRWISERNMPRIEAAFGSLEEYEKIPDWEDFHLPPLETESPLLDHGYDESKPLESLSFEELAKAAEFRGGKLETSESDSVENMEASESDSVENMELESDLKSRLKPDKALEWSCSEGHRFRLTPRTVLKGGHWCPECLAVMESDPKALGRLAEKNHFLRQITLSVI